MNLKAIFPKASNAFLAANEKVLTAIAPDMIKTDQLDFGNSPKRRGQMNKTEAEFALILEAQKRRHEIVRYEFEGITLRFAGVKYTPDFVVFPTTPMSIFEGDIDALVVSSRARKIHVRFIEVKGPFTGGKFERAIERFRHARTYWHEFQFELHQKTRSGWRRVM